MDYVLSLLILLLMYYPLLDLEIVRIIFFILSVKYMKEKELSYVFSDFFRILFFVADICIFLHDIWPILLDFFISISVNSVLEIPSSSYVYIPKKKLYSIGSIIFALNVAVFFCWIWLIRWKYGITFHYIYEIKNLDKITFWRVFLSGTISLFIVFFFL